jgi:hypothetical protein
MKGLGGMKMKGKLKSVPGLPSMPVVRGGKTGVAPGNARGGMNPQKKMPKKA